MEYKKFIELTKNEGASQTYDTPSFFICTTSEAINKTTITAIKLLILRSFQRKGLCNSDLKAKSTTFAYNNK